MTFFFFQYWIMLDDLDIKLRNLAKVRDICCNFFYFYPIVFFYIQILPKYFHTKINLPRLPKLDMTSNLLLIIIIWSNFRARVRRYMC